jgi:hypothetical protein
MGVTKRTVLLLAAVALTGCATAEDIRKSDEAKCTSYGFRRDTPEFASCVQQENIARRYGYRYGYGYGYYGYGRRYRWDD